MHFWQCIFLRQSGALWVSLGAPRATCRYNYGRETVANLWKCLVVVCRAMVVCRLGSIKLYKHICVKPPRFYINCATWVLWVWVITAWFLMLKRPKNGSKCIYIHFNRWRNDCGLLLLGGWVDAHSSNAYIVNISHVYTIFVYIHTSIPHLALCTAIWVKRELCLSNIRYKCCNWIKIWHAASYLIGLKFKLCI